MTLVSGSYRGLFSSAKAEFPDLCPYPMRESVLVGNEFLIIGNVQVQLGSA